MKTLRNLKIFAILALVVIAIAVIFYVVHFTKNVKVGHTTEVIQTPTPVDLDSIKTICQWSVVSVELDQVVDTVDEGFLSSDRISVGYHGTLHYGIDLAKLPADWMKVESDTVVNLRLPDVSLLDDRFLDERNTTVYEGRDDMDFINKPSVRAALSAKAKTAMIRRGDEHKAEAREKVKSQVTALFLRHGYKKVNVDFVG